MPVLDVDDPSPMPSSSGASCSRDDDSSPKPRALLVCPVSCCTWLIQKRLIKKKKKPKKNKNKVDVHFPHILMRKLHTQACEIVAETKKKLCKKFQVDIYKTKKDGSVHAQLCTL